MRPFHDKQYIRKTPSISPQSIFPRVSNTNMVSNKLLGFIYQLSTSFLVTFKHLEVTLGFCVLLDPSELGAHFWGRLHY